MENIFLTSFLMGGLGNQMFQIAKAYTEEVKNNINVVFRPTSFIPTEGNQPSKYLNNIFRNINFGVIDEESFLDENGNYFISAPDVAYSFPMIEMAGYKHYEFIPNILHVYNENSPYNEHKIGSAGGGITTQYNNATKIRNMKKYNLL